MARKPRFNLAAIPQHIVQRGSNRQSTFFAEQDYRYYLECLGEAAAKYACAVHAYTLTTNHVHLLMTPSTPESIPRLMQSVGRRYVQYVNYHYRRTGTLWEGRYKASLVQTMHYLLACSRYIELNPVRANMVERPEDYAWSSYRANAQGVMDDLVQAHTEYLALGGTEEERQIAYRTLLSLPLDQDALAEFRQAVNQGLVTGGSRFTEEVEAMLARRVRPAKRGRPEKQARELSLAGVNNQLILEKV